MGNNNINGDLSPKLKAIIADGKVEAKEVKGLTNEEKAELENYLKGTGQMIILDFIQFMNMQCPIKNKIKIIFYLKKQRYF